METSAPSPRLYSWKWSEQTRLARAHRELVNPLTLRRRHTPLEHLMFGRSSPRTYEIVSQRGAVREQVEQWATSLDPEETSGFGVGVVSCPRAESPQEEAALTLWTYAMTDDQRRVATEVGECGHQCWVAMDEDGPCVIRNSCKHRHCPACRNRRSRELAGCITTMMEPWKHTKFITFSRSPRDLSLNQTIKSLVHDFNRLRRTAIWKASAGPGVYSIEITRHPQRTHYHVHLHALVDSQYIPQAALSDAWKHITGDSMVVDIRAGAARHATYMAKYISKAGGVELEPWEVWAYQNELSGARLVGTFGGAPSLESCKPEPRHTVVAPLHTVQQWAMDGNAWAQDLLNAITERLMAAPKGQGAAATGLKRCGFSDGSPPGIT